MKTVRQLWCVVFGLLLLSHNAASASDLFANCDPEISGSVDKFLERVFDKEKFARRTACLREEEGLARTRSSIESSCMRAIKQRMANPETIYDGDILVLPKYRRTDSGYLFSTFIKSADGGKSWDCYLDTAFRVTLIK